MESEQNNSIRGKDWLSMGIFFLVAAALRLCGNGHGLPWIYEPDPDSVVLAKYVADDLNNLDLLLNPSRYPHLLVYFLAPVLKLFPDASEIWIGRTLSGLLGAGTVVFTFLCGMLAAGRRAGWLAALMVCFSFLAVQHSHLAKPHVGVAFFTTACLYGCMRIMVRPSTGNFVMAGLFALAAGATLHSGFVVLAALAAAVVLAPSDHGTFAWRRYFSRGPIWVLVLVVLAIPVGYPNRIVAFYEIMMGRADWHLLMAPHVPGASRSLGLSGFLNIIPAFTQYDPWVGILGAAALLIGLVKKQRWWKLCLPGFAMALLFFALFGHLSSFVPRFLILVLPPLSVGAAALLVAGMRQLKSLPSAPVFALLIVILLLPGGAACLKLDRLYLSEDTREETVQWIEQHIEPGTPLAAVPFLDFPLPMTRQSIKEHEQAIKNLPRWERETLWVMQSKGEDRLLDEGRHRVAFPFSSRWKLKHEARKAFLEERGVRYGISVFYSAGQYMDPDYNVFSSLGTKVKLVAPGAEGFFGFNLYRIPNPFWNVWKMDKPGPLVEIVEIGL
jgi:hypothetical protein